MKLSICQYALSFFCFPVYYLHIYISIKTQAIREVVKCKGFASSIPYMNDVPTHNAKMDHFP